mgnify:CR=1 FL=1
MSIAIAIDGPAGAGKSTISKSAAKELGFIYVDTGALYRTVGLASLRNNVEAVAGETLDKMLESITVELTFNEKGEQIVLLDGENVSDYIRTPEASMLASKISAIPSVRAYLLDLQRNMAKTNNVIMDGRDIGTVVLPNAEVKIFLTASSLVRAQRRHAELLAKGEEADIAQIEADIIKRDEQDMNRAVSPLKQAEDAVLIDSSYMTIDEVVARIMSEAEKIA